MTANILRDSKIVSIHLPAGKSAMAGVLSYLGIEHKDENDLSCYIDVAITVMIVAFVLVFAVNMVSLVVLNQNMKTMADQIADYATMNGIVKLKLTQN